MKKIFNSSRTTPHWAKVFEIVQPEAGAWLSSERCVLMGLLSLNSTSLDNLW